MESILKEYLKNKRYGKCISLLEENINLLFLKKVQSIYPNYEYTTILEIAEISKEVFSNKDYGIFIIYFDIIHDYEMKKEEKVEQLMEIYASLKNN